MSMKECSFCCETRPEANTSKLDCGHRACALCLRIVYSRWPAVCCFKLPLTQERAVLLGPAVVEKYITQRQEHESEHRVYCSRPHCSAFIIEDRIFGRLAICPSCRQMTCTVCRQAAHGDAPCRPDTAVDAIRAMAEKEGWKACPACDQIVERTAGCNRMWCVCLAEFCYNCGAGWKTCDCEYVAQAEDPEQQAREDARAQEFMAHWEETTQHMMRVSTRAELGQFLQRMMDMRRESPHPDWWDPFIEEVHDALEFPWAREREPVRPLV